MHTTRVILRTPRRRRITVLHQHRETPQDLLTPQARRRLRLAMIEAAWKRAA
jgi:hypothetical protein